MRSRQKKTRPLSSSTGVVKPMMRKRLPGGHRVGDVEPAVARRSPTISVQSKFSPCCATRATVKPFARSADRVLLGAEREREAVGRGGCGRCIRIGGLWSAHNAQARRRKSTTIRAGELLGPREWLRRRMRVAREIDERRIGDSVTGKLSTGRRPSIGQSRMAGTRTILPVPSSVTRMRQAMSLPTTSPRGEPRHRGAGNSPRCN